MVNSKHHKLVNTSNEFISNLSHNKFLIAYSGGIDSSVLLDCFYKLSLTESIEVRSIHINHGLTEEASLFEDHCKRISENYGIAHITENLNINVKSNIEEKCRKERYKKFVECCHEDEIIITAHHEEDQIETFFLRLIRGSGARGFSCIKENTFYDGKLVARPFLKTSKREIKEYSENNEIEFIEDKSNSNNKFDRNFLRNELIPLLKSRWPSINKNIVNNILVNEIQSSYISDSISAILPNYLCSNSKELKIKNLIDEPFYSKVIILHEWVYLETNTLLNLKQINEIIKIMNTNNDSNPLFTFGNAKIKKDNGILILSLNDY
ncbi:MAG: tRNA lysidine(34) synthetase TilS [Gammaproteobacteria bacterium]|nr:tRNA lysidine(34) synthetase TilS [Gammaproteobacteria bacterium]MBT5406230.1 tRNA lysidine(34) synthetase TilS [Gammaproteobacteria bacterium]MBT5862957.1 tRNA lysidine(34) synthetase TilS [Gammaproteobacteria bacterium]MBT7236231.1 tRNA lysidine(34) synthetase TilS [Gammaproteobacteria bacterium]|tara:strand:- start:174 stop:1142 length:969 start_codon:yes stop_codon:yes gene_type:complete